jgi:hypothetical protein
MPAQTVIKLRKDSAANWASVDPILANGEVGIDTTVYKFKVGNGSSAWSALPFASDPESVVASLESYADAAAAGALSDAEDYADGLASNYDPAGTASSAVTAHNDDTTSVHGIADTTLLLTTAGGTLTGYLNLHADPTQALHAVTKEYVDNVATGVATKPQVLGATTTNIDATYDNGTAGVGATLTRNTNGVFPPSAGGATGWSLGKGILVKNQTNKAENGRYYISDMGSESTPYVLTRCSYCDTADEIPGAYIFVQSGTNAGTGWIQVVADPATFVVGTDNIDVFQFSGAGAYTAGNGLTLSGTQFAIDTDVTATKSYVDTEISGIDLSTKQDVVSGVSSTEIGYLDGVTSSIQTQLNAISSQLNGVTFIVKSNIYIAVASYTNTAAYSTNGITWTQTTMPATDDWLSVTYGGDKFVAVASSYNAAYSTDGITWTQTTMPVSTNWRLVAYGGNKFVALVSGTFGGSTTAAYSTNGITWTETTMPSSDRWLSATYGEDKFVAVASYITAAYSTDGITWTQTTMPVSDNWRSVTYGGNKFVALASGNYSGSTTGAYSTNGITWTETTMPNANWRSVTYGEDKFVAVTGTFGGSTTAAYSTNGITWTQTTMPNANWLSVTYGEDKFVAVASSTNTAAYSTNGITWTQTTMPASTGWRSVTNGLKQSEKTILL